MLHPPHVPVGTVTQPNRNTENRDGDKNNEGSRQLTQWQRHEPPRRGSRNHRRSDRARHKRFAQVGGIRLPREKCQHSRRHEHATARQPCMEEVPRPGEPTRDRAARAAEHPRRLLLRFAFKVAEHHGGPQPVRQSAHLLIENGAKVFPDQVVLGGNSMHFHFRLVHRPPAPCAGLHPGGGPAGDPVQPVVQQIPVLNRPRLADQNEKGGLKRILRVVGIAEHTPAHAEHHRPVSAHKGRERTLIAMGHEIIQQLGVGQTRVGPRACHEAHLWGHCCLHDTAQKRDECYNFFSQGDGK